MADTVAALDADVLVPILACDFLLTAFDHGLFEPVVSSLVLTEVQSSLAEDFPSLEPAAVSYRADAMRDALTDHIIEPEMTDRTVAVNAKDRHVDEAALAAEAALLVTNDQQLRQDVDDGCDGLLAVSLDSFAGMLCEQDLEAVAAVIDALVSKRSRPSVTRAEMLRSLEVVVPSLVSALPSEAG